MEQFPHIQPEVANSKTERFSHHLVDTSRAAVRSILAGGLAGLASMPGSATEKPQLPRPAGISTQAVFRQPESRGTYVAPIKPAVEQAPSKERVSSPVVRAILDHLDVELSTPTSLDHLLEPVPRPKSEVAPVQVVTTEVPVLPIELARPSTLEKLAAPEVHIAIAPLPDYPLLAEQSAPAEQVRTADPKSFPWLDYTLVEPEKTAISPNKPHDQPAQIEVAPNKTVERLEVKALPWLSGNLPTPEPTPALAPIVQENSADFTPAKPRVMHTGTVIPTLTKSEEVPTELPSVQDSDPEPSPARLEKPSLRSRIRSFFFEEQV